MNRFVCLCVALFLAMLLTVPASAARQDIMDRQEEALDVEGLERTARENGSPVSYGVGLDKGLSELWNSSRRELGGIVRRGIRSGVVLLLILMLCGMADTVRDAFGGDSVSAVSLAGALGVATVTAVDVNSLLGLGRSAIDGMTAFANVLLPAAAAAAAAAGAVTGAAVRQMAAVLFCDLLVNLINGLLVPLLFGYIALSVGGTATGNSGLDRMASLLKWVSATVLTLVMMAFVSYLSLSGVVAGGADAVALKTAKFAISSTIPVIGGILADAADSILASAGILKGTLGVFGALTVIGICLIPLLRMAVHYLVYKLVSALASAAGNGPVCGLVDRIGSAFGLLMGMTGACCLLLLIAMVSSASAVIR